MHGVVAITGSKMSFGGRIGSGSARTVHDKVNAGCPQYDDYPLDGISLLSKAPSGRCSHFLSLGPKGCFHGPGELHRILDTGRYKASIETLHFPRAQADGVAHDFLAHGNAFG